MGLPPLCSDCTPNSTMAGIKKLVPSKLSSVIMIQETISAGKANKAKIVAVKIPHTVSGMRINVIPRVRA